MTDTGCFDCHHTHAGPELANICIGCPCPTRPLKATGKIRPTAESDGLHRFGCMTQGCGSARISSHNLTPAEADSEARTAGWTIWAGTTQNGADSTAIYCPTHAGKHSEPGVGELVEDEWDAEWDAECDTCMTNAATDDPGFDGTEQAAEEWADDHVCESITRTLPPKTRTVAA